MSRSTVREALRVDAAALRCELDRLRSTWDELSRDPELCRVCDSDPLAVRARLAELAGELQRIEQD